MLFHNHPSGLTEPSVADELITRRLREALALIDVRVLDHLIVGDSIFSFAEADFSKMLIGASSAKVSCNCRRRAPAFLRLT